MRLRITAPIALPAQHPHLEGKSKDGRRVWLGELMALSTLGDAPLSEAELSRPDGETPPPAPFVRIRVESIGWLADKDFIALVEDEIPASTTYELFVGDRQLWPPPREGEPTA